MAEEIILKEESKVADIVYEEDAEVVEIAPIFKIKNGETIHADNSGTKQRCEADIEDDDDDLNDPLDD